MNDHIRDVRTGRPLGEAGYAVESLTDDELEEELTIAAAPPDHLRFDRYEELLRELQSRRRLVYR